MFVMFIQSVITSLELKKHCLGWKNALHCLCVKESECTCIHHNPVAVGGAVQCRLDTWRHLTNALFYLCVEGTSRSCILRR